MQLASALVRLFSVHSGDCGDCNRLPALFAAWSTSAFVAVCEHHNLVQLKITLRKTLLFPNNCTQLVVSNHYSSHARLPSTRRVSGVCSHKASDSSCLSQYFPVANTLQLQERTTSGRPSVSHYIMQATESRPVSLTVLACTPSLLWRPHADSTSTGHHDCLCLIMQVTV